VVEGQVRVRTGDEPVLLLQGNTLTFGPGISMPSPSPVDPWRIHDWLSAPTASLDLEEGLLRLTLRNDSVLPIAVKPFNPAAAAYSLLASGPDLNLPLKIQESMLRSAARGVHDREIVTLQPGERYDLLLDPGALGLPEGTWRVSAVYKPYPPLPENLWRGHLKTEARTIEIR
jgi:hypothetical protein